MPDLTLSDWLIVASGVVSLYVAIIFTFGRPRRWFSHPLGWATFILDWATVALFFLIIYAIFAGERLVEWARVGVGIGLLVGLLYTAYNIHVTRRETRRLEQPQRKA